MYGSKVKILKLFALGLALLLIITKPAIFNSKRITVVDAASPFFKVLKKASTVTKRCLPFASYRDQIDRLNARIGMLSQEVLRLKSIEVENERLRALLYFKKRLPFVTIPAQVIGRDPSNWSNSVIIDKGREQSMRPNMAVISSKGLIGRILETGKNSSKILLITDPNSKVGAILERTRQGGVVVGRPDGLCKMIYISLDTDVAVGEKVITAGYGTIFPKGVLIGEVVSSGKEPGRLYRYAVVKTSQDFSKLEEVLCIR